MSLAASGAEPTLRETVTAEVRANMARFGLKQKDLADLLQINQSQASKKLRGVTPLTLDEIEVIAAWFSTSPAVLMGYATEPRPKMPNGAGIGTPPGTRTLNPLMMREQLFGS